MSTAFPRFVSVKEPSYDRRVKRRPYQQRAASSSRSSIYSGITQHSSSSSGSGSTITQESVTRSRARRFKPLLESRSRKSRAKDRSGSTASSIRSSERSSKSRLDVFAFLDADQSRTSLIPAEKRLSNHKPPVVSFIREGDSDDERPVSSLHSDSGISMRDDSPEPIRIRNEKRRPLTTLHEELPTPPPSEGCNWPELIYPHEHGFGPIPTSNCPPHALPKDHYDQLAPESFYITRRSPPQLVDSPPITDESLSDPQDGQQRLPASGYDQLAERLTCRNAETNAKVIPLYRRFEKLNHRILLQLQDEIIEMEEDLASIDEMDTRCRTKSDGRSAPASRRMDWRWRSSEHHMRRLELLGRICVKIEQYSTFVLRWHYRH